MKPTTKTPNKNIYTEAYVIATNADNFTKRVGSICCDTSTDTTFLLLDTSVDFRSLPRPNDKETVFLKIIKRKDGGQYE